MYMYGVHTYIHVHTHVHTCVLHACTCVCTMYILVYLCIVGVLSQVCCLISTQIIIVQDEDGKWTEDEEQTMRLKTNYVISAFGSGLTDNSGQWRLLTSTHTHTHLPYTHTRALSLPSCSHPATHSYPLDTHTQSWKP